MFHRIIKSDITQRNHRKIYDTKHNKNMTNGSNVTQNTTHWKLICMEKISSGSRSFSPRTRQRVYILRKLPIVWYHTVKMYHTDNFFIVQSTVYQLFLFLGMILAGHAPHCVCRCQYNFFFCELFLAAHFSQKIEQPSEKVPTVHFSLQYYFTI